MAWLVETGLFSAPANDQSEPQRATALLEPDWLVRRGAHLKLTAELLDPDRSHCVYLQTRFSVVGECTPMQYLLLRPEARLLDEHSARYQAVNPAFLEVHVYF